MPNHLENFTHRSAKWTGRAQGFIFAVLSVCAWGLAGEDARYYRCSGRHRSFLVVARSYNQAANFFLHRQMHTFMTAILFRMPRFDIERLPPGRKAAILATANGRSYEEVAQEIGIPLGTVKSRLARARDDLRHFLGSPMPE